MAKKNKKKEREKESKPINIAFWAPIVAAVGLIIGFAVCYLTFVHYGGN